MNSRERFQNAIISNHLKLATVEQQRAGEDVLKLVGEKKTKQRIQATGEQSAEMVTGEGAIYVTSNRGYNSKAAVQETVWATLNSFQYLQPLGAGRSGQGGAGRGWSSLTCSRGTPVAWSSPGAEARRPGAAGAPVVGWIAAGGGGGAATCGGGAR